MLQHIAFIMDGNRRWARDRHLPTLVGHTRGYERIEKIVKHAQKLGISYLTFWAFSTENWNRSQEEVFSLFDLFRKIFRGKSLQEIQKRGAKICVLGNISRFPRDMQESIQKMVNTSQNNTNITVNIALNYGGREEIMHAIRALWQDQGQLQGKAPTREQFENYLYTAGQPDPDLIVRTGGGQRLSGFLLWQSEYSELYFTDTYWPDFDTKEFDRALAEFERRERRFGK